MYLRIAPTTAICWKPEMTSREMNTRVAKYVVCHPKAIYKEVSVVVELVVLCVE